jgi:hypothetical protein
MDFRRRFRLFVNVVAIVAVLIAIKLTIHVFHAEFLALDTLFSSIVAGTIFIIGFLLTGLLPDFKEAERMPAEIRTALEAIHDDVSAFSRQVPAVHVAQLTRIVLNIVDALERGLGNEGGHAHLEAAIEQADKLVPYIAELERLGMSQNFVVRIRSELDVLRKCLYRVYYIQKIEFVPSVHVLIQTLVCAVLFLLLFLKTDGSLGSAIVFGFVSYLFVFALHLIAVFEQPFRQGTHSADKVSLFLLREFVQKVHAEPEMEQKEASSVPSGKIVSARR